MACSSHLQLCLPIGSFPPMRCYTGDDAWYLASACQMAAVEGYFSAVFLFMISLQTAAGPQAPSPVPDRHPQPLWTTAPASASLKDSPPAAKLARSGSSVAHRFPPERSRLHVVAAGLGKRPQQWTREGWGSLCWGLGSRPSSKCCSRWEPQSWRRSSQGGKRGSVWGGRCC